MPRHAMPRLSLLWPASLGRFAGPLSFSGSSDSLGFLRTRHAMSCRAMSRHAMASFQLSALTVGGPFKLLGSLGFLGFRVMLHHAMLCHAMLHRALLRHAFPWLRLVLCSEGRRWGVLGL